MPTHLSYSCEEIAQHPASQGYPETHPMQHPPRTQAQATLGGKSVDAVYPTQKGHWEFGGKNKRDLSLWARLINFFDFGDFGEPYSPHGA